MSNVVNTCIRPQVFQRDGKKVLAPCYATREDVCPGCAEWYRLDVGAELRRSLDSPGQHLFITLTAPSFGRIHKVDKVYGRWAAAQPGKVGMAPVDTWQSGRCDQHWCPGYSQPHVAGDGIGGSPLDSAEYDYEAHYLWQSNLSRLIGQVTQQLHRAGGEWARCLEPQLRGAQHVHALVTLPASLPVAAIDQMSTIIENCAMTGTTASGNRIVLAWGEQFEVEPISGPKAAYYVAKYVAKGGIVPAPPAGTPLAQHYRRLQILAEHGCPGSDEAGPHNATRRIPFAIPDLALKHRTPPRSTRCRWTGHHRGRWGFGGRTWWATTPGISVAAARQRRREWVARPRAEELGMDSADVVLAARIGVDPETGEILEKWERLGTVIDDTERIIRDARHLDTGPPARAIPLGRLARDIREGMGRTVLPWSAAQPLLGDPTDPEDGRKYEPPVYDPADRGDPGPPGFQ